MTRGERMSALALSTSAEIEQLWGDMLEKACPGKLEFEWIRQPEFGAVMIRGRIGGDGGGFNFGEAAVTRCVLRLVAADTIGVACVIGRRRRHATLAALLDAVSQIEAPLGETARRGIRVMQLSAGQRRREIRASVSRSEVDFSMLLRSETP